MVIFLLAVRSILLPFVVAAVLAYISSPLVEQAERRLPLPRVAVVALLFVIVLVPLVLIGIALAPAVIRDTVAFLNRVPDILTSVLIQLFGGEQVEIFGQVVETQDISDQMLGSLLDFLGQPSAALRFATSLMELVLYVVLSLVLLFYFLVDRDRFAKGLILLFPKHTRPAVQETTGKIHVVLGHYLRGLLLLVVLMSIVAWLGLSFIFHLPYAVPIAIATGFLETVPLIGPIIAGGIAAIVGLEHGGVSLAIWIIIYYYIVRQIEDQLVAPYVLGRAIQLHPVIAIFAVLAGGALAGIPGMMFALPAAAAIRVLMDYWHLTD